MKYLVDYHFGRLSRQLNAAVEAHVRDCKICQRQGLSHAATEKREIARKLRRVRPTKKHMTGRMRVVLIFLAVVAILQVGVYELSRGSGSPLNFLFGGHSGHATTPPTVTPTSVPTPPPLARGLTYDSSPASIAALSLSPDGKTLATASLSSASPVVRLWNTATGKPLTTLDWPGQAAPGVFAWSLDGKMLAAADSSIVGVWVLPSATPAWTLNLPAPPAVRVYDAQAGALLAQPDPASTFVNGSLLQWSTSGSLTVVSPSSGTSEPVTASGAQRISVWRAEGTHLFTNGRSGVLVGISSADANRHDAILSWSPDGKYLFWASLSQPVKVPGTQTASTPSPSSTPGASQAGIPAPNAIVSAIAAHVAASEQADALIWFSTDGRMLAACDRTVPAAALDVYNVASGRIVGRLVGACGDLEAVTVAWQTSPAALIIAQPGEPITSFALPNSGS